MHQIKENILKLLEHVPPHVTINAASKFRTAQEINHAIKHGIKHIAFNYVKEGVSFINSLEQKNKVQFHLIGYLQSNKAKLAVENFHSIDTVHSFEIAKIISEKSKLLNKKTEIMIQVKDTSETHKNGVFLEQTMSLINSLSPLSHIHIKGLLAMGDKKASREELKIFFRKCKQMFDKLREIEQTNLEIETLSMGMSESYLLAIEEGANQIRLGTSIYGPRDF